MPRLSPCAKSHSPPSALKRETLDLMCQNFPEGGMHPEHPSLERLWCPRRSLSEHTFKISCYAPVIMTDYCSNSSQVDNQI